MTTVSIFLDVPLVKVTDVPLDAYHEDPSPQKVCLGHAGCQTDADEPWIPPVTKRVMRQAREDPTRTYEYLPELGIYAFTKAATELALGKDSRALLENRAGGVQTLGGTGAVFIGAEFLRRWYKPKHSTLVTVYIGAPQLGSLGCIFKAAGFTDIHSYHYWDSIKLRVNIGDFLKELQRAAEGSVVFMHAPEETGLTQQDWVKVAAVMERKRLFPFFDMAAQGLASGNLDIDAWAVRLFVAKGFELLCAQSLSKIFGLYDERMGNLIVVTRDNQTLIRVHSQITQLIDMMWFGPTNLGARIITMVLTSPALLYEWKQSLRMLVERMMLIREKLKEKLRIQGTPGSWEHLTAQSGTRSFIGLLPSQVEFLANEKHIYLLANNQISICSVNSKNLNYVVQSIHEAVTSTTLPDDARKDLEEVD
ncbi:putative aspartate aminotransferase, cytoplasmic 2 [Tiliqua scincoides]|uniref:putative aspartate aminotransferase, cytoplasmic 2 n=1 Tax=Tiliqua scincoides TaxID=71010 RepID=UPI003462F9E2